MIFEINGKHLSREPTQTEHGETKIEKTDRTINGSLVVDIIAYKNKVNIKWDYITDIDMKLLLLEIKKNDFCSITLYEDKEIKVYANNISYVPFIKQGELLWRDVYVEFVER